MGEEHFHARRRHGMTTTLPHGSDPKGIAEPLTFKVFPSGTEMAEIADPSEIPEFAVLEDPQDRKENHPFRLTEETMRRLIGGVRRWARRRTHRR